MDDLENMDGESIQFSKVLRRFLDVLSGLLAGDELAVSLYLQSHDITFSVT